MTKRRRIVCIFLTLVIVFLSRKGVTMRLIPDDNLRYPVLLVLDDGSTASGFYLNADDKICYFVTAKHVLFKKDNKNLSLILKSKSIVLLSYPAEIELVEPIEIELQIDHLYKNGQVRFHPSKDVVVIKIAETSKEGIGGKLVEGVKRKVDSDGNPKGRLLTANIKSIKNYDDVLIGNNVFIFGYPTSLGIHDYPQIEYKKPLLRKGIIAGKNNEKKTIILDCPVYYGNSGGPVIEEEIVSLTKRKFWIIGVVSEFIPFEDKWYNIKHQYFNTQIENSGYSVITPMDAVLDLINE